MVLTSSGRTIVQNSSEDKVKNITDVIFDVFRDLMKRIFLVRMMIRNIMQLRVVGSSLMYISFNPFSPPSYNAYTYTRHLH